VLTPTGYEAFTICTNGFIGFVPALLCCWAVAILEKHSKTVTTTRIR
jgi:hypothetical protein